MLLRVLQEHARHAVEHPESVGGLGDDIFVMERIAFDRKHWMEQVEGFDPTKSKANEVKFQPELVFSGRTETGVPLVNSGNPPNAKKATIGAMPTESSLFLAPEKGQPLAEFWNRLIAIFDARDESILDLGWEECSVFKTDDPDLLSEKIKKSALLPYRAQAADSLSYALLALHSLNVHSSSMGLAPEKDLFSADLFRFLFLFRAFQLGQDKRMTFTHCGKVIRLDRPRVVGSGSTGDITKHWLSVRLKGGLLGVPNQPSQSPVSNRFHDLLTGNIGSLKFDNRPYSTYATGIAPTNPFRDEKGKPVLHSRLMLGADPDSFEDRIPGYGPFLTDTRLRIEEDLHYYILPDQPEGIDLEDYLENLRYLIRRTGELRKDYFKAIGLKNEQEKEKNLEAWRSESHRFWEEQYAHFSIADFLLAFESDVGSGNKPVFSWVQVHRGIEAPQAFLLLFHLNHPAHLPRLIGFLKQIEEGHTLGGGWVSREIRRMIAAYLRTPEAPNAPLDYRKRWMAWRGYFTRANTAHKPIHSDAWEQAMGMVLRLNTMRRLTFDSTETTGQHLIQTLEAAMEKDKQDREETILNYLKERFPNEHTKPESQQKLNDWLKDRAETYARFVETDDEEQMQAILDGLIVGWGLKTICLSLRGSDYKLLIGGKSLARYAPAELRSLMIDLRSKAERQGRHPWNSDVPVELGFLWSQKNPASPEVTLFMDSASLGFYRWDPKSDNTSSSSTNESES